MIRANNVAILTGRLVRDVEVQQTSTGTPAVEFTLAVDGGKKDEALFIDCQAYESTAEFIGKNFSKGKPMMVCGYNASKSWKDKNGANHHRQFVKVESVAFVPRTADEPKPAQADDEMPF